MSRRSRKEKQGKVGGFAYYLSFFSLLLLSGLNTSALFGELMPSSQSDLVNLLILTAALCLGLVLTRWLAPERLLTFLHETKHALLSGLAGNRWKEMKVDRNSGHFEYSYTKETAHLNALIALAPYYLPLLTIPVILLSVAVSGGNHQISVAMIALAFGSDLFMNFRDISPRQSDFSGLHGGFGIGALYVLSANLFHFTLLAAWALRGSMGLQILVLNFWHWVERIVHLIRQP